ncbi:MAG TPA: enoyl-CoA hydratase-related protein [Ideonella sp.]|nr:enoyl-CoA hydratase-related protein [Ideonella sp.]
MSGAPVTLRHEGAFAWLMLDRPAALNALDVATAVALDAALAEVARDPGLRALVLHGAGRAFCAGGDLHAMRADPLPVARALIEPLHAALRRLDALPVPVLASVHGQVAGAGMSLMLACDLAIAADDCVFNLAYAKVGASCDGSASWHLPRVVGLRRALEIALLGESLDAAEALRLGLVNRIVPAATLADATGQLARRLAEGPTRALGEMRRLLRDSPQRSLDAQLDAEHDAFLRCAATADFRAALDAFAARKPPRFAGR